jgi:hypothetical protein
MESIINPNNFFKDPFGDRIQTMKPNQPVIIDMVTLERLHFQSIPREINVDSSSTWVAIESVGRNNPFYHFTGSEDIIQFTLSWFCDDESRQDVIKKCKWLEALTKNDGYDVAPHPVKLVFGDLFKASTFIVHKAKYQLANFNREYKMMPMLAFQEVELRKITSVNTKRDRILNINT